MNNDLLKPFELWLSNFDLSKNSIAIYRRHVAAILRAHPDDVPLTVASLIDHLSMGVPVNSQGACMSAWGHFVRYVQAVHAQTLPDFPKDPRRGGGQNRVAAGSRPSDVHDATGTLVLSLVDANMSPQAISRLLWQHATRRDAIKAQIVDPGLRGSIVILPVALLTAVRQVIWPDQQPPGDAPLIVTSQATRTSPVTPELVQGVIRYQRHLARQI